MSRMGYQGPTSQKEMVFIPDRPKNSFMRKVHLKTREEIIATLQICNDDDLGIPAVRTVRDACLVLVLIAHSLQGMNFSYLGSTIHSL